MTIEVSQTVTLASVDVSDDYRVALTTLGPSTTLTSSQARRLGQELINAAMNADDLCTADYPIPGILRGIEMVAHSFDLEPMCTKCRAGDHEGCIESAWIVNGPEVDEVSCNCEVAGHPKVAGQA